MKDCLIATAWLLLASVTFSALATAQNAEPKISTKDEITADINAVPCKNADRLEAVRNLFKKLGASDGDIAVEGKKELMNLVVTKKGKSEDTIIVGAHYDKVADGCGAIDNWTGITIIAHLYRTFKDMPTEKTYRFVAFGSEETGLRGSAEMAKAIPKEKRSGICSMVNFDSFGFAYPRTFSNGSTPKMVAAAKLLSAELKIPFADVRIEDADADSSSFLHNDIPAITFDGLDVNWQKYLHSSNDKVANINMDSVFAGYLYGTRFLAIVDVVACSEYRKK
jgi:Zn-dependent M28 family amino/carboxypeptidase